MTKSLEKIYKMHNCFVDYDCIQMFLGYENYVLLFGNNDLMYYNNLIDNNSFKTQKYKNVYLVEPRSTSFPYSSIPEHKERFSLFRTGMFANQILEYNKPYVQISDKILIKRVAYKENGDSFIYSDILNGQNELEKTFIINRKQLQRYFYTGMLENYDDNEYNNKYIISSNGVILKNNLISEQAEQKLIDFDKKQLSILLEQFEYDDIRIKNSLLRAINEMSDIEPLTIADNNYMVKLKDNGDILIDNFIINYLERNKYEIIISKIPVNVETLEIIKSRIDLSKAKTILAPKIKRSLNPDISLIDLEIEKMKENDVNELKKARKKSILRSIQRQEDTEINEENKQRKKSLGRTLPKL